MTPNVLEIVKHQLFGQSVIVIYQMPVINKVYVLYVFIILGVQVDHHYVLSFVDSLKEVENKILR